MTTRASYRLYALLCVLLAAALVPTAYAAAGKGSYALFVLNEAASGKETEFNRWYDEQHAQDVLINPTYIDSQRYVASERQLLAGSVVPAKYAIRFTMVTDATWRKLASHYDSEQLITVLATVARYRRVSMTLNALGVQSEEGEEKLPVLDSRNL